MYIQNINISINLKNDQHNFDTFQSPAVTSLSLKILYLKIKKNNK